MVKAWNIRLTFCLVVCLVSPSIAFGAEVPELELSFKVFLGTYVKEIKRGNADYLETVHPKLPEEMHEFFLDITLGMMKHADEKGLFPKITCREYNICKATWPQPGGSWAAQTFIRHEGDWLWLEY